MTRRIPSLPFLVLVLAGCGAREKVAPTVTPEAVFASMRETSLAGDWDALYELNAPSERAESEARWERVRDDPTKGEALDRLAVRAGVDRETLATMSLRAMFAARNQTQLDNGGPEYTEAIRASEVLAVTPEPGDPDTVMVQFRIADGEPKIPMRREQGRWWLWRTLTALTDL